MATPVLVSPLAGRSFGRLAKFAVVGGLSTVVHLGLFAALDQPMASQVANMVALVVATVFNTALNRAWTFGLTENARMLRHHVQALAVFGLTWGMSALALWGLDAGVPHHSTAGALVVVAAAMAVSTVVRFVAMERWIFRAR